MDNGTNTDYCGIKIKSVISSGKRIKYCRDKLSSSDKAYLQNILDILRINGRGDPIKSGLSIGYIGINGMKRPNNLEVIFVGSPENLIDKAIDIYNLYGVHVGFSLYAQNIPDIPIAALRDGVFKLL